MGNHLQRLGEPNSLRHAARVATWAAIVGSLSGLPQIAWADLTDPEVFAGLNALEQNAARANQAVFDALVSGAAPVCAAPGQGRCTGDTLRVFENVRELVHTSNELVGRGPTEFSLGLDPEGLGFALRWTAAEELLAQGSMSTDFAASQLSSLAGRIGAIRIASRASLAASMAPGSDHEPMFARRAGPMGGGASADAQSGFSRLSVFVDGSGGYGNKAHTPLEDAFDFEGTEYTLGADYRFTGNLVAGALLGFTSRLVDFDSSLSVVDGEIDSDGFSAIAFLQWDQRYFYATASAGYQQLAYEITRSIRYPSFNPNVPSTNTVTSGDTDSTALLATLNLGVPLQWRAFGADLYVKADYQRLEIDAFSEIDAGGDGFQFNVAGQSIRSLDAALGLKLQLVWTPRFAVIVPFVRGEMHREFENDARTLSSVYAGLPEDVTQALIDNAAETPDFGLFSDPPDDEYYTLTGGFSIVLRGSQRVRDGVASGGLQGYLQYTTVEELENYSDRVIAGGIRYEF